MAEARRSLDVWLVFYNDERKHQSLDYQTSREVFDDVACEYVVNISASLRDVAVLTTYSQAHRQQKGIINVLESIDDG